MTQPRYQIFVSSTFKDLEDERQAVLNAILKLNQFPAGMEIFPAVNDTAWEHIEKVIEDSDYYVLIIGGKYGSIEAESGISYTEKEYDFAVSKNIPVLAFTHSDEQSIPIGKSEMNEEIREKLKLFKRKVGNKHHWNYWKTIDELKANVATSLAMSFVTNPQKGWVKAGGIEKGVLLEHFAELQQKYNDSQKEIKKLKRDLTKIGDLKSISNGDEVINFEIFGYEDKKILQITWNETFNNIGQSLSKKTRQHDYEARDNLKEFLKFRFLNTNRQKEIDEGLLNYGRASISIDEVIDQIGHQFVALNLIKIAPDRKDYLCWSLTEKGRIQFASLNAL